MKYGKNAHGDAKGGDRPDYSRYPGTGGKVAKGGSKLSGGNGKRRSSGGKKGSKKGY